jgi:hypothetical protein
MTRWHPWRHLRDHHPDIDVTFVDLGDCGCLGRWTHAGIEIERTSDQRERRCTLTHELIHHERGPVPDHPHFGPREEAMVEKLTARRLITIDDLVDALVWSRKVDEGMAIDLWVDLDVLLTRIKTLTDDERRYIDDELERRA